MEEISKLQEEFQSSQENFKALFENGPIGVAYHEMIYDDQGNPFDYKFIDVNQNFLKYTGIENPTGKTVREAFPGIENDPFDWIGKYGKVVQTGETFKTQQHLPLNDRWYDLVAYKYKPNHFVVAFLDITDHKKVQDELQEVNSGMKAVVEASSRVSIIKTDLKGKITLFNRGAEALLGYKAQEVIGRKILLLFHKNSEIIERSIELTAKFGYPVKGFDVLTEQTKINHYEEREWTYHCKDGSEKIVTLSVTPIFGENNKITGFLGTAVDITDRKMMEKALKNSETLFRSFFEDSADAFMLLENGKLIDCNPATVKLFGLRSKADLAYTHLSEISPKLQEDGRKSDEKAEEMMRIALKSGSHRFEWLHRMIDDTVFPAEILLTYIVDDGRQLLHACIRDISDRKEAEAKLLQSQKMEVVGQLAGGVAHDFNNMLSGIIGATEVLQMEIGENQKLERYTSLILQAADRASDLTQQLLAFGRKGKKSSTIVNLHEIIKSVKEILKHTINKNISINTEFKTELALLNGDPSQIQNAILNLAINARDAMSNGGTLSLIVEERIFSAQQKDHEGILIPNDSYFVVSVNDTGTGISEEELKRIFEPFYTTKGIGKGTGLGLASVYGTVKSHNAFLRVKSEVDKGTSFELIFKKASMEEKESTDEISEKSDHLSGTVLVIDDEQVLRDTMKIMLESIGLSVILAENGIEGIKKAVKFKDEIDLVILDLIMPRLSGRECLQEMLREDPECKALLVSGFTNDEEIDDLIAHGKRVFLKKPFRKSELLEAVKKLLN